MTTPQTPADIRDQSFPRKLLGLDADGVHAYLDRLADEAEAAERELAESRAENQRLAARLERVQAELEEYEQVGERTNEQMVQLLSQAQLVAEEMVQDVTRDARERISHARAHERKIVEEALDTAGREVSTYARSAQARMQSIVDSFATEVDRMGGTPPADGPGEGVDDPLFAEWPAPATGREA
ncbi:DivIVA domain-containing protein [Nocardioides coralli]|uniref:DivIVA domain-containing protein n=1 Tax=Nocardioides coralli TaxID=2872154 RepID=UPI001CA43866|nr:DivIVA domain-containing protein [Nocardioides coralli]QZY29653.1 DivIVA domain-containing protein [Nocardioides coralli]